MSSDEMRAVVREVLREVTNGNGHSNGNGKAESATDGDEPKVVPQVPAPPVAAVLRPSTWDRPPAPGEVIGNGAPTAPSAPSPRSQSVRAAFTEADFRPSVPTALSPPAPVAPSRPEPPAQSGDARVEVVAMGSDEDLEQFVRDLMGRLENPRERLAIRTGRLRFRLHRSAPTPTAGAGASAAPATRVERGAVTERMIRAAAAEGTRLVLAPAAVLTPLAREQARARGVEIERERRC